MKMEGLVLQLRLTVAVRVLVQGPTRTSGSWAHVLCLFMLQKGERQGHGRGKLGLRPHNEIGVKWGTFLVVQW